MHLWASPLRLYALQRSSSSFGSSYRYFHDEAGSVASCASDGNGPDAWYVEGNKNIEIILYAPHFSTGAEAAVNENAAFGCNTEAADDDAASDASDALDV